MNKKRLDLPRRGQVTVFIIIGMVLLFVFLSLTLFTSSLQKSQLEQQQEDTFTKTFKKESLRLFVDTCLRDGLEEGLILLGKQGRIWNDQPGGRVNFEEGVTGHLLAGETAEEGGRVFYGLVNSEDADLYPCDAQPADGPCRYNHPDIDVGFGSVRFRTSDVSGDLKRFLVARATECVEEFTREEISELAEIETTDVELRLTMHNDLISVDINYPLKFSLGGQEFFQLSKFDFTYPTKIKQLLDSVVTFPLGRDQKFVDFEYTPESLSLSEFTFGNRIPPGEESQWTDCVQDLDGDGTPLPEIFTCTQSTRSQTVQDLAIRTEKTNQNGDDLFVFTPAEPILVNQPGQFSFRLLRQNRPPALEYIERRECLTADPPYNYLVIKDDADVGDIELKLLAHDPDEKGYTPTLSASSIGMQGISHTIPNTFTVSKENVRLILPSTYTLNAIVTDEHGASDSQEINILVDNPIEASLEVDLPYMVQGAANNLQDYATVFSSMARPVSIEDPVSLSITVSSSTSSDGEAKDLAVRYFNDGVPVQEFGLPPPPDTIPATTVLNLPGRPPSTPNDAATIFADFAAFSPFINQITRQSEFPFRFFDTPTTAGELRFSYAVNYCQNPEDDLGDSSQLDIIVAKCIPHVNPEYPFAYPRHDIKNTAPAGPSPNYMLDTGTNVINPFLATHTCCKAGSEPTDPTEWELQPEGHVCFNNPFPGCYGKVNGFTSTISGYILENEIIKCSGTRGNVCDGSSLDTMPYTEENAPLICGKHTDPSCDSGFIEARCQGRPAYGTAHALDSATNLPATSTAAVGLCFGTMGCQNVCDEPIVALAGSGIAAGDTNLGNTFDPPNSFNPYTQLAESKRSTPGFTSSEDLQLRCGCRTRDANRPCDRNWDGIFDGTCQADRSCR